MSKLKINGEKPQISEMGLEAHYRIKGSITLEIDAIFTKEIDSTMLENENFILDSYVD